MLLNCSIVNSVRKRIDDSKQIPNYSNYVILPNEGLIYSLKQHKFIGWKTTNNRLFIELRGDNGNTWNSFISRIIYTSVYGEIPEGMQVNHIDEDKNNNCISNLNLMTSKENNNWGTHNERSAKARSKSVGAYKNGELVMTFSSIIEAQRNGFNAGTICYCCKGKHKTHKGYKWQYIETEKVA